MTPPRRILVRATNWVGDVVMAMPPVEHIRHASPAAHLAVLARPWVAGLYRPPLVDEIIIDTAAADWKDLRSRWRARKPPVFTGAALPRSHPCDRAGCVSTACSLAVEKVLRAVLSRAAALRDRRARASRGRR